MCVFRKLGNGRDVYVTECTQCHRIYLSFREVTIEMTVADLCRFSEVMQGVLFETYSFETQAGEQRIVVNTPVPEVYFHLKKEEFEGLKQTLHESVCMLEVFSLLQS